MPVPTLLSLLMDFATRADRLHQEVLRAPMTQAPERAAPRAQTEQGLTVQAFGSVDDTDSEDFLDSLDDWHVDLTEEVAPARRR